MSHFTTLVNIKAPGVDLGMDESRPVDPKKVIEIAAMKNKLKENPNDIVTAYLLSCIEYSPDLFESIVSSQVDEIMAPFCEESEDPDYLEFVDIEEEEQENYESKTVDCVKMANGTVCTCYQKPFSEKFELFNGLVYQSRFGRLKHQKRTKRAKQITVLPNYPFKKVYKTFESYLEDHCGYEYDKDQQAYGYYTNPNAQWDWFEIGGRWPFQFLVSKQAKEVIKSRGYSDAVAEKGVPEGYRWVAGARKADIEWDLMKSLTVKKATKRFFLLEQWYRTGNKPDEIQSYGEITDNGIEFFQEKIYSKGETLEQYLFRLGLAPQHKISLLAYSFIDDGVWNSEGDMGWFGFSSNDKDGETWRQMIEDFIVGVPDNSILVSVDCHI